MRNAVVQNRLKPRYGEVALMNGVVGKKGKEVNVPTPRNEAVMEITRQIQIGILAPVRSNPEVLQKIPDCLAQYAPRDPRGIAWVP